MKKIILIAAIAVCSISSQAQVSFGAQVGANLAMGHTTNDDPLTSAYTLTNDPKVGFLIGVLGEVDFGKIAFRPELNFIQKGSKSGYSGIVFGGYDNSNKRTLNYIEIPLNVVYNLEIGKAGKVFFGLGPAIGIGLSGKDKLNDVDANGYPITVKRDVKFDGKKDADATDGKAHLKRLDVGASILAGYQLPMGLFAKLSYTYGFMDIDADTYYKYKNRGFSICIGYMLGGKKDKK